MAAQAARLVTAGVASRASAGPAGRPTALAPSVAQLSHRALLRTVRLPQIIIPVLVMPVFFVIAFTGSFEGVTGVQGFPTDNFVNWIAAYAMVQGSAFAGVGAAGSMAQDLDSGFIDRLMSSPIRRLAILIGPLVHTALRALIPVSVVLAIATVNGLDYPGGVAGVAMAFVGGVGAAITIGCIGLGLVLRIGNIRAMAIVQIIAFAFLFPSIGQVPISLMSGWLQDVARVNPATNVLRMTRQGFIGDVTWADTWPGLLVIVAGTLLFGAWARYELNRRADLG